MKKFGRTVCLLLCLVVGMSAFACGKKGPGGEPTGGNDLPVDTYAPTGRGIHEVAVSESDKDFTVNGNMAFSVVTPSDPDADTMAAVNELKVLLSQSTGVEPSVIADSAAAWSETAKYIVLGADNALVAAAGVTVPTERLGRRGAYVETRGHSVFLAGATSRGTLNAVYEWLHYQLGFEAYATNAVAIQTSTDSKLKNMKIVEVPDIGDLEATTAWTGTDPITCNRLRYTAKTWIPVDEQSYHNSFAYLPPKLHKAAHSEWYSDDGTQLCYLAHGDADSLALMIDTLVEKMKKAVIAEPDLFNISITQQDDVTWCSCPACTALNSQYGTDAVSVIRFCNAVSRKMSAWFETDEGKPHKRDLKIAFFAYHPTQYAPVKYDKATDSYAPIDDTVLCDDNVGVIYAPIRASYQVPFDHPYNKVYYDNVRAWPAVSKNIYMWTYSTNFHYYLVPTNTYNSMQYNYRFMRDNSAVWLLDQTHYIRIGSGFSALKQYLNTKLAWNADSDFSGLIDAFFQNYFGPGAESMRAYFDELRAHWLYLEGEKGYIGDCYLEPLNTEYWPYTLLESWKNRIDDALTAIEPLKQKDATKYKDYSENIRIESICIRFLMLDLWPGKYDKETLYDLRQQFRNDCNTLGFTHYAEKVELSQLWSNWGI